MPRKSTQQSAQNASDDSNEVSYAIITAQGWNVQDHVCGPAKPNKSGQGKSASLTYNKRRFYLKTPKMYCPFGASKPKPKPGETPKENEQWSVQMAFGDETECQLFQQKANEFDEFMIDEGSKLENNVGWLGGSKTKPFSREVVESKYSRMVKYSKDKTTGEPSTQYPPFVRAAFPTTFKAPFEFTCEIYDKNNSLMSSSPSETAANAITRVVPPGCWCTALLSGSIWCNTNGFGVTWRVAQLKVFAPKGAIPKGKCLVDDPADESDESDESDEEEEKEDKEEEEVIEEDDNVEVETEPVKVPEPVKVQEPVPEAKPADTKKKVSAKNK